jgi:hypothetical protein
MLPEAAVAEQVAPPLQELHLRYENDASDSVLDEGIVVRGSTADASDSLHPPHNCSPASRGVDTAAPFPPEFPQCEGQFEDEEVNYSDNDEDEMEEHIWKAVLAGMFTSMHVYVYQLWRIYIHYTNMRVPEQGTSGFSACLRPGHHLTCCCLQIASKVFRIHALNNVLRDLALSLCPIL